MTLKTDVRGMVWRYPDYFVVGREQAREYARAVKCDHPAYFDERKAAELGHDAIVAPITFVSILAKYVQVDFFRHVDVGMENLVLVQVDQRFVYFKPILVGEKLWARMDIRSVEERFGAEIVVTKNVLTNDAGDVITEGYTTLMGQYSDDSAQLRWDAESGQVIRTA